MTESDSGFICGGSERMIEVVHDVLHVFDTYREANEFILDPQRVSLFSCKTVVADGSGVCDQRFDASQAGSDEAELEVIEEFFRGGEVAFDFEGNDASEAFHLFNSDFVMRVGFQARVIDAFYGGMRFEESRDAHTGSVVDRHAEGKGF